MQSRQINAQHPEFLAGFVGSQAAMTPPSASGRFVEAQPLNARLLKPPEAAITETTLSAHSLESAAPCCCIEKSKLNHRQRHTKKVLVQRSSGYIAIMPFAGRSCLTTAQRFAQTKGLRANPSFERTRSGRPLQAFISFSAKPALSTRGSTQTLIWLLSVKRSREYLCRADRFSSRCRMGNVAESTVATCDGCATVAHADIRGLGTSRQIYVAGLPSL